MSAIFNPIKATSLPASPAPHSVYFIKGGSDVRVKGYITDANGTAFPLGIIDESDVLSVQLDGFTVGSDTPINSNNSIFTAFRNVQGQLNTLSTAVAGGIKIPLPLDASGNPDYPAAEAGDSYLVTVAGKIGGVDGELVQVGDKIVAKQTNAGGNQATVGSAWFIVQGNVDKATDSIDGITRIATQVEVNGGSENFAYVTPATLRGGVRNTTLTGYSVGSNTALTTTDNILQAFGKIQGQINAKEDAFTKNTAFNKNFGTTSGTVAEGNDSRFHDALTLGTNQNGLSLVNQVLSLGLASTSTNGALSSTDWNTFNNKQNALTNPITGTGVSGQVSFWTGAGTQGGDNGFSWNNTNKTLSITGSVNIGDGVTTLRAVASAGVLLLGTATNHPLAFRINNVERWRITDTGILQSNGAQTIQTSTGNLTLATAGGNGNILLSPNGTGNVGVKRTPTSDSLEVSGEIKLTDLNSQGFNMFSTGSLKTSIKNNSGNLTFFASGNNSDGTERMRITSTGNVGIGTTTPEARLDVRGTNGDVIPAFFTFTGGFSTPVTSFSAKAGLQLFSYQREGNPFTKSSLIIANADGTVPSELQFWTKTAGTSSPSERLRITSTGNVGIGTTSPLTKLHILAENTVNYNPVLTVQSNNNRLLNINGNAGIDLVPVSDSLMKGHIGVVDSRAAVGTAFATDMIFATQFNNSGGINLAGLFERMRITSGGNVGIGTTSPSTLLHVFGSSATITAEASVSNSGIDLLVASTNSSARNWSIRSNNISFGDLAIRQGNSQGVSPNSNGTVRMYFNLAGNVGIGTTSPTRLLNVNGAMRLNAIAEPTTNLNAGDMYYDSTSNRMRFRRASDWVDMGMLWAETQW
jgi:hypothetical protein